MPDAVLLVHPRGTFRLTGACVPHFREQGYGRVVNVTSYTGMQGNPVWWPTRPPRPG